MANTTPLEPLNESQWQPQKVVAVFALCAILGLTGCGYDIPFVGGSDEQNESVSDTTSHMETAPPPSGAEVKPLTVSPPVDVPRYNPKNMFGESLRGDEERIDRLERAVQSMRNDFDSVTPSIKRLMAIEGDIQTLLTELKRLNDTPAPSYTAPASKPVASTPKPAPVAKTVRTAKSTPAAPPVVDGRASVYNVRIGEHPGKTRIVLDVNTKTGFSTDLDNGEKILIVELPSAGWSAAQSKSFGRSPLLASYNVESSGGGSMLIFQLKRSAKIAYKEDIGGKNGGRRIVLDIVAQ